MLRLVKQPLVHIVYMTEQSLLVEHHRPQYAFLQLHGLRRHHAVYLTRLREGEPRFPSL